MATDNEEQPTRRGDQDAVNPPPNEAMPGAGAGPRDDATGDDVGDAERRKAGADPAAEPMDPDEPGDASVLTLTD